MKQCSVVLVVVLTLLLGACSSSNAPAVGSPEWLWNAAKDTYTAGDLEKTCDNLYKIEKAGSNPYVQRARAWRMLLLAGRGMARVELAQAYADGWKATRTEQTTYARQKNDNLLEAKRHAFDLFEEYGAFAKDLASPPQPVVLEFSFPQGSAAQVTEMDRVYKGMSVTDAMQATAQDKMVQRGVIRAIGSVLATEDDAAGAQTALKSGRAEVPPARFVLAVAVAFNRLSGTFDRKALNEPEKQKLFQDRAVELSKKVLDMKPDADTEKAAKKLQADIEKAQKGKKGRA